jgi:hypothetical protein
MRYPILNSALKLHNPTGSGNFTSQQYIRKYKQRKRVLQIAGKSETEKGYASCPLKGAESKSPLGVPKAFGIGASFIIQYIQ